MPPSEPQSGTGTSADSAPRGKNSFARSLFSGIASSYHGPARLFSFFQYDRWHRFLVSRLELSPSDTVLDVCTGTGLVASQLSQAGGCRVTGLDLSDAMLAQAQQDLGSQRLTRPIELVMGRAEQLPFRDETFDVVVFTFLLRYVDAPRETLRELARVLRPGGQMASLEFYVPQRPVHHALWKAHTRAIMPLASRLLPGGWPQVGAFLGPSISAFYQNHPLEELRHEWESAGISGIQTQTLSLGGAVVMWGRKAKSDEG